MCTPSRGIHENMRDLGCRDRKVKQDRTMFQASLMCPVSVCDIMWGELKETK